MSPYRVAEAPREEPPGDEEAYAARLRALGLRTRVAVACGAAAVVGLGLTAFAHARAPREGRLAAHPRPHDALASLDAAERAADAREEELRTALLSRDLPAPSGACRAAAQGAFGPTPITKTEVADLARLRSAIVQRAKGDLAATRHAVASGSKGASAAVAAALPRWSAQEVVFVASRTESPIARAGQSFAPGSTEGVAYVYDFASRQIVCAARVEAKSSDSLAFQRLSTQAGSPAHIDDGSNLQRSLDEDLARRLSASIAASTSL